MGWWSRVGGEACDGAKEERRQSSRRGSCRDGLASVQWIGAGGVGQGRQHGRGSGGGVVPRSDEQSQGIVPKFSLRARPVHGELVRTQINLPLSLYVSFCCFLLELWIALGWWLGRINQGILFSLVSLLASLREAFFIAGLN